MDDKEIKKIVKKRYSEVANRSSCCSCNDVDDEVMARAIGYSDEDINNFLKNLALPNQERKFSNTYAFNLKDSNETIAFFTLSASQLNTGDARLFGIDKVPPTVPSLGYKSFRLL